MSAFRDSSPATFDSGSDRAEMPEGTLNLNIPAPDSSVARVQQSMLPAASTAGTGGHVLAVPQAGGAEALSVGVEQGLTPSFSQTGVNYLRHQGLSRVIYHLRI
jgi:hypothetical protein